MRKQQQTEGRATVMSIIQAALQRVDPKTMMVSCIDLQDTVLHIRTKQVEEHISLEQVRHLYIVGAGKASIPMAHALESILGSRITGGLIAFKPEPQSDSKSSTIHKTYNPQMLSIVEAVEAGHPVPSHGSVIAAQRIMQLVQQAEEQDLILNVISGGGSALLALPAEPLSIADMQSTTECMLAAGITIDEMNIVRKHLSAVKGGRLAQAAMPAQLISLILSDVVGDNPATIASGITAPDDSTYQEALNILTRAEKRAANHTIPPRVMDVLRRGMAGSIPETPKQGDSAFRRVRNILIGSNTLALHAAKEYALQQSITPLVLTSRLTGEAREMAKLFAGIAQDILAASTLLSSLPLPACIITGGETTVTLRGTGAGGRNQEMALSVLVMLYKQLASLQEKAAEADTEQVQRRITFASIGTDGNDGPTDAAGGWADTLAVQELIKKNIPLPVISAALHNNDSYHMLEQAGALIKTGITHTNVCDIQVMLIQ